MKSLRQVLEFLHFVGDSSPTSAGDADDRDVAVSLGNRDSAVEALAVDGRRSAASLDDDEGFRSEFDH